MPNWKNLSEKQALTYTIAIVAGLCLLPTCLLAYFQYESGNGLFSGVIDNPANLTKKIETQKAEIKKIDTELAKKDALQALNRELDDNYERYKKALPATENLEDLYVLVGNVLQRSNLRQNTLAPIRPKGRPAAKGKGAAKVAYDFKNYQVVIEVEGNYQDIISFVHQIEDVDFERFVLVNELKLQPAKDPENESNLEYMKAHINFISFFYTEEEKPKAVATPARKSNK